MTFVVRSALGTNNRTYRHTRAFLDPVDPGRFDPRTNEREVMLAPSARTYTSMYRQAMEYQSLLGTDPSAADKHYERNGQGVPTPFYRLTDTWCAVLDAMHVVQSFICWMLCQCICMSM